MPICPFISTVVGVDNTSGDATAISTSSSTVEKLIDCKQAACAVWDSGTSTCGANTMTLRVRFDAVIGVENERDSSMGGTPRSLIAYLNEIVGIRSEQFVYNADPGYNFDTTLNDSSFTKSSYQGLAGGFYISPTTRAVIQSKINSIT